MVRMVPGSPPTRLLRIGLEDEQGVRRQFGHDILPRAGEAVEENAAAGDHRALSDASDVQGVGQALTELGATLNAALVVIGDRLGLYKAMADSRPVTPAQLAGARKVQADTPVSTRSCTANASRTAPR